VIQTDDEKQLAILLDQTKQGDQSSAIELLKFCFHHLSLGDKLEPAAFAVDSTLEGAPDFRRYQIACLYMNIGIDWRAYALLAELSWEDKFPSAQWQLGRLILYGRLDWVAELNREMGYDLLCTAHKNGHLCAIHTFHWARYRDASVLFRPLHFIMAVLHGFRIVFLKRVLKKRGRDIL